MDSKTFKYSKPNESITNDIIDYYDVGGIETIEIIKSKLSEQQFVGFLRGNIIKYICRAGYKKGATATSDYDKAAYYTNLLVKEH